MEGRRQPARKARVEAQAKLDEEVAIKVAKKRGTPDSETSVKKPKGSKVEETGTSETKTGKKGGKAATKKSPEKPEQANGSKHEEVAEKPVAMKNGKGKKAADEEPEKTEVAEEKKKVQGRGKRGSPPEESEAPAVKKGRGGKKATSKAEEESTVEQEEPKTEDKEAQAEEKSPKSGKKLQNSVDTNYKDIDFGIKEKFNFKITTWNVAGLRALVKKNPDYFTQENADIICMNEIKCGSFKEIPEEFQIKGYHAYWNMGKGAGGVALLSKVEPIQVTFDLPNSAFSDEKRAITAEFEKFFVVSTYVVNAGRGLKTLEKRLEWNEVFDAYVKELDKKKPVIITGDMNVAHQEIDLANPKTNKKNAGFTQEERDGFTKLLSLGFVDTFRHFYPELTGAYTFWTYMMNARSKNVGWRLDYFLVSERLMKHVKDNVIRSTVLGSDHCPIVLFLDL